MIEEHKLKCQTASKYYNFSSKEKALAEIIDTDTMMGPLTVVKS